jgi:hypothetical protein
MQYEPITVDTHLAVKALMEADFSEEQAEAVVNTIKKINLSHLATKADVYDLKSEMEKGRADHKADLKSQRHGTQNRTPA